MNVHKSSGFDISFSDGAMVLSNKVYLNGKLVGEVPPAKDRDEQADLALDLLKSKGLYKPTTKVQAVFRQAVSFATTASHLYNRDLANEPRNGLSVAPFIVNGSFAIELYLKTLGELHGQHMWGHDLLVLFDALPDVAREALLAHFASSKWQCGIISLEKYRDALDGMRGAFIEWRYLFEKSLSREIEIQSMIFIMEVLHNTCKSHEKVQSATTDVGP